MKKIPDNVLIPYIETFPSIQGEGMWVGAPSIFVRVGGCNLHCEYCDTKYSWYTEEFTSLWAIYKEIHELIIEKGYRHIVFTGGEPLLYWENLEQLIDIIYHNLAVTLDSELFITIETNGSIYKPIFASHVHLLSISPKLQFLFSPQPNHPSLQYRSVLKSYVHEPLFYFEKRKMQFKFLIDPYIETPFKDVEDLLIDIDFSRVEDRALVVFQPIWYPDKTYEETCRLVTEKLQEALSKSLRFYNYRTCMIPQVHKLLWGNERCK